MCQASLMVGFLTSVTAWKVTIYGVFSGPHFPVFGLNTEIYEVNLRIHSEHRKMQTRKNSVFGHFSRSVREPRLIKRVEEHEKIRLGSLFEYQVSFNKFLYYLRMFVYIRSLLKLIFCMERRQNVNKPRRQ